MKGFSQSLRVFQERRLPERAVLAGYAALIEAYQLKMPLPQTLCAIGEKHKNYEQDSWRIFSPRYTPAVSLEGQITFALKHEGLDLGVLKKLFEAIDPNHIIQFVQDKPRSQYSRRVWFLYEWLTGKLLDLPDAEPTSYANVVDEKLQYAVSGITSKRHRVRNNLPGTPAFCPLIRCTEKLEAFIDENLGSQAASIIGNISKSVLARTAAFLLLKDSKSSFAIENESPAHTRIQRWGKAIGEAGKNPLDAEELLRLQSIVMGDARFITLGFREEGGFIGEHDRETRLPLPVHISARHEDLSALVRGLIEFDTRFAAELDPIISAAILAFGFVNIHPFEDGNGRVHRYLIHHALASRGFTPPGIIFPVSSVILERIDEYVEVLEQYSETVLPFIEWEPTSEMNVRVLNETADYYAYFDATHYAEFLFSCVKQTIEHDLPEEAAFLKRYDRFKSQIETLIEMPASLIDLLFNFLKQNNGTLSKRARSKEFDALTDDEVQKIEVIYREIFSS